LGLQFGQAWLRSQFAEKKVEPNSGLGEAITYLLKHWEPLTLFLRKAGAPLDNNVCERALKKAILHRKNSLFYKTGNGARVGDLYMSLIHTCELNDANPFEYLTERQRHAAEMAKHPARWMPWNYRQTLQQDTANEHSAYPDGKGTEVVRRIMLANSRRVRWSSDRSSQ